MTINREEPSMIHPDKLPTIVWDHERRLGKVEQEIPSLIQTVEIMTNGVNDLKNIVIKGNEESMQFMKSVINHDQNMETVKSQLKQEITKAELTMKQKQMDMEEKHREEKEAWERKQQESREEFAREQKKENRKMIQASVMKIIAWGAPIATVAAVGIAKIIERWF